MHFHIVLMYKDKEVKNVKNFFVNVWRKNIFDIYVTEYGTALTTILPILVTHWQKNSWHFLPLYLYAFSLYENAWLIIFSAETEYISTRYWYRNIYFWHLRHRIWYCFDNYFTYFVPVFRYCYSDSRNLWTVMRTGGLVP
jgi:hypothetical protein